MEFFQLHHPLNVTVLCDRKGCEQVADYLEVDDHGQEYRVCASHTDSKTQKLGSEVKLGLSSFRGRAVSRASHDSKTESGALSFACSCQRSLQVAVCRGNANGSSGRSASERKIRTRLPCRQPRTCPEFSEAGGQPSQS
jgi:hypothetical protein